jgi:hypothetical protein
MGSLRTASGGQVFQVSISKTVSQHKDPKKDRVSSNAEVSKSWCGPSSPASSPCPRKKTILPSVQERLRASQKYLPKNLIGSWINFQ